MSDWQNRIVGHGTRPADEFLANPDNPRTHPQKQRDAMRGSLDTLGWIAPVIVNAQTGYLVDGHERVWQAMHNDNASVPFIEVSLTPDEEKIALASFDFITYMAQYDRDVLDGLLRDVNTDNAQMQELLSDLAVRQGVVPVDDPYEEWVGMPEFEQEDSRAQYSVVVNFESEEAIVEFARLMGQTVTDRTTSIWYPKRDYGDAKSRVVLDGP